MGSVGNNVWPRLIGSLFTMVMLLIGGNAMAEPVRWNDLNSTEKSVLKAFQGEWEGFSEKKQNILRRWASKPESERARIKKRYAEWKQLSPQQQRKVAQQLKRFKTMSPSQKARVRAWHEWVQKLPEGERKKLRESWPTMTDAERRAYMKELQKKYGHS
ncbi:DUF3106 domain-containing protein [Candidatus Thiothrix sp. Deng01]|uniref:DUF3106 domain-containing protein n=1 Tax=Candidatus Thiothrix phosphatis TaxID=3112415 RepID=A0ABU6CXC4_9GAMM|nr:DUF3106 domain-containing protein [Candidatus Thiothrix sp. Deng01]MEB4591466.1 DUF3106 domain-containing protein [Candidatus Thiothrix sp. Deng01]